MARPEGSHKCTEELKKEIKRLLGLGVPKTKIASYLGVSVSTINRWIKLFNLG
jgi:DNA invertase Pin-like site-specific DNA recombinase